MTKNIKKATAKYINGPFTLSKHHSNTYNKTIYIFGEVHGGDLLCNEIVSKEEVQYSVNITDYLHTLFSNTNVFIDFYLETPLPKDYKLKPKHAFSFSKDNKPAVLTYLRRKFINCTDPKKRNMCVYSKHMRAHIVDIRESTKSNPTPTRVIEKFRIDYKELREDKTQSNIEKMYNKYRKLINYITNIKSRYELSSILVKFLKAMPILRKEINRSELDKKIVYNMAKAVYYKNYSERGINNIQLFSDTKHNKLFVTESIISLFDVFSVDIYTIVRTFKTFRKTKLDIPDKPSNIIYYFGNTHSENLRAYLSILDFDTLASIKSPLKQDEMIRCLKMGDFPQPFFT